MYIDNLKDDGGVLIFLPGWAWISELNSHLHNNKVIGKYKFLHYFFLLVGET